MSDMLAAILERDPDWHALPADDAGERPRLLQRCLEKDPSRRLRDIGDARMELDGALSAGQAGPIIAQKPRRWSHVLSSAAVLTILIAASVVIWNRTVARQTATVVNLQRFTDFVGMEEYPAASPDGKTVAFIAGQRAPPGVGAIAGGRPSAPSHPRRRGS